MSEAAGMKSISSSVDVEKFRLRNFVDSLRQAGEVEVQDERVELADIANCLDASTKAVLFRNPGGDKMELVGNVMGSRQRLALAFGIEHQHLAREVIRRAKNPIPPVEVSTAHAPVHEVVWTGEQADFRRLPIHLQHAEDGGPYITASIDVTNSIDGRRRNIGMRRMMLRGRKEAGIDLVGPSDLRAMYGAYVERKERMPIAIVVGSHPLDSVAATQALPEPDELAIMGAMRGSPVPLVRCVTMDLMVPADAEIILEGYLDERGWKEYEGPFGEFLGYYGLLKSNPVFHLTAITMRRDALFQTLTIGGRHIERTDTGHLVCVKTEAIAWSALETAVRDPVAVYCCPSVRYVCRASIKQRYPGEAKNAIAAIMGSAGDVKSIFIVDDDIDIFSEEQMNWALGSRFQADRDLMVASGFRAQPLDPSLEGRRVGGKVGFDLTIPFGQRGEKQWQVPDPLVFGPSMNQTVREALAAGPKNFRELMEATGTRDGRDVLTAMDELRAEGKLERQSTGRYSLKS